MNNIENRLNTNNWFNFQDYYDKISSNKNLSIFVEVGVWKGHSISYLVNKLKQNNNINNCKIYAVDLVEETTDYNILRDNNANVEIEKIKEIYEKNLELTNTRSYITDIKKCSWEAADLFENESIDFCFIDADHTYDSVRKDIISWLPKIKKNGILSGHDYSDNHPGVPKAVKELLHNKSITVYNNTVWEIIK